MSREYPDWVDPRKAAEARRIFAGSMPVQRMSRLWPLLAPPVDDVRFSARFTFDDEHRVVIQIEVDADLPLICQRSLERYLEPVHRNSLLGVMDTLAEEALLPGHYEPVLAAQGRVALQDLVEDELLLALPQVPRNPALGEVRVSFGESGVAAQEERDTSAVRKPFAGLAEQMRKQARDRDRDR